MCIVLCVSSSMSETGMHADVLSAAGTKARHAGVDLQNEKRIEEWPTLEPNASPPDSRLPRYLLIQAQRQE
ncbi:hypothetical protein KC347_g300 [Hortaea werneckii]|nr:hypothetical protein KC347_g300 [Hortaea werneckii]